MTEIDMVNSPPHYTAGKYETIDIIEDSKLGYHLGNAIKYIMRSAFKGKQDEDLAKAIWYLERYRETGPYTFDTELAWCAGFFDGEGNCGFHDRKDGRQIKVQISQAGDIQVLERFRDAVGDGTIYGPHKIYNVNAKPCFTYQINTIAGTRELFDKLKPYLSLIKYNQFSDSIYAYDSWVSPSPRSIINKFNATVCQGCGKDNPLAVDGLGIGDCCHVEPEPTKTNVGDSDNPYIALRGSVSGSKPQSIPGKVILPILPESVLGGHTQPLNSGLTEIPPNIYVSPGARYAEHTETQNAELDRREEYRANYRRTFGTHKPNNDQLVMKDLSKYDQ